ncbi:MAG: hypothetical protein J0G30_00610 [Actinomycetales bacterium]|nr:hypothetical protein [Actinomycetales bacterium]
MDGPLAGALAIALTTVLALVVAGTAASVALLRRRARAESAAPLPGRRDAGSALLRADEELRAADDELDFALAQFGAERTADFRAALARAHAELAVAFRDQQRLDTGALGPDSRRRTVREIRGRAERVRTELAREVASFRTLRRAEADAPATIRTLRARAAQLAERVAATRASLAELGTRYVATALGEAVGAPDRAETALAAAGARLDEAEADLARRAVPAVGDVIAAAEGELATADQALRGAERRQQELAAAEERLAALRAEQRGALEQARALRDAPPDPDSGAAVGAAIAALEPLAREAAGASGGRDPLAELDGLVAAADRLDQEVSATRNQQRRLDGAREAYAGARLTARSEIGRVQDYLRAHGGGQDARTRLAEAERQLELAEAASDPVEALDAARRAQTHARDADALARFRG